MSRARALLGSALFLVLAPGTVAGLIPWWFTHWEIGPPLLGLEVLRYVGGALIVLGALGLLDSFVRFAWTGRGTPAPVAPTQTLVVNGLYRYVRNPMYVAVISLIKGQALLFGSWAVLIYAVAIWLAFQTFVSFYEEPTLRRTYGEAYETYRRNVRRWIPRLTAWRG